MARRPRKVLGFTRCQFHDDLTIQDVKSICCIRAVHCSFGENCVTQVHPGPEENAPDRVGPNAIESLDPTDSDVWVDLSTIHGQFNLNALEPDPRFSAVALAARRRIKVAVTGSVVSGQLDVLKHQIASLDLRDTSFPNGRLVARQDQLVHEVRAGWGTAVRLFLDFVRLRSPGDRPGVLSSEQRLAEYVDRWKMPVDRWECIDDNPYHTIASEYGELRNSFSQVAESAREEAFCHYKYKDYIRRGNAADLRRRRLLTTQWCKEQGYWLAGAAAAFVGGSVLGWPVGAVLLVVLSGCRIARAIAKTYPKEGAAERIQRGLMDARSVSLVLFDWVFSKWLLGYGVYARRVFTTAGGVILLCALLFGIADHWSSDRLGWVECGETRLTTAKPSLDSPGPPASLEFWAAVRNCLYYSVVTFTTLGYGDFAPKGPVQLLAAAEALLRPGRLMYPLVAESV